MLAPAAGGYVFQLASNFYPANYPLSSNGFVTMAAASTSLKLELVCFSGLVKGVVHDASCVTCRCRGPGRIELIMPLCSTADRDLLQRPCVHFVSSMDTHIIDSSAGPAPNTVRHT